MAVAAHYLCLPVGYRETFEVRSLVMADPLYLDMWMCLLDLAFRAADRGVLRDPRGRREALKRASDVIIADQADMDPEATEDAFALATLAQLGFEVRSIVSTSKDLDTAIKEELGKYVERGQTATVAGLDVKHRTRTAWKPDDDVWDEACEADPSLRAVEAAFNNAKDRLRQAQEPYLHSISAIYIDLSRRK